MADRKVSLTGRDRRDASASQTAPAPLRCITTLGPKNDAVTASAVAAQRRRYAATLGQSCRCDGATERCNTVSAGEVEAGNRVADEQADRFNSGLEKSVVEKQADSLRLLVEVAGHGAFVAAFRDRSQIALADVDR
jgi:hypothetical protein